jgi:hypothetical protein
MIMRQLLKPIFRAKSVDTEKRLKDNTRQNDYTNLMEEYKQILKYIVAHGVTQECLKDLSDIHREFEAARRKWAKMSLTDASSYPSLILLF